MKALSLALLLNFLLAFPAFSQKDETISLLVQYNPKGEPSYQSETVEQIDFRRGKLIGRKILFNTRLDEKGRIDGFYGERYITLSKPGAKNRRPEDDYKFDLQTGKFFQTKPEDIIRIPSNELLEIPSPDGKKKVLRENLLGGWEKLVVRIEGRPHLVINEKFDVTNNPSSSMFLYFLPVLWLDDERILTQKKNGRLVVVTLDGKVEPFPEIPCTENELPDLIKTKEGKIIYLCENDEYLLDIEKRRFAEIKDDLENGFSEDYVNGENVYYYRDEEIGREGLSEATAKNYLAVTVGPLGKTGFYNQENQNTVKVWNKYTKDWTILKVDGGFVKILGWRGGSEK